MIGKGKWNKLHHDGERTFVEDVFSTYRIDDDDREIFLSFWPHILLALDKSRYHTIDNGDNNDLWNAWRIRLLIERYGLDGTPPKSNREIGALHFRRTSDVRTEISRALYILGDLYVRRSGLSLQLLGRLTGYEIMNRIRELDLQLSNIIGDCHYCRDMVILKKIV